MVTVNPQYPFRPINTDPANPLAIIGDFTIDQSPNVALKKEAELLKADPVGLIRGGYLRIKDKEGNLIQFLPNKVQNRILDIIQVQRKRRLPVRLLILKGRQFGVSTLSEALIFAFSTQRAYGNGMVVADDQDGAEGLFEMTKLYQDALSADHPHLAPQVLHSNEAKLEYKHKRSIIRVETAGKKKKVGRKYTIRVFHGSECAFWPNFSQAHKSISQSVPEKPETIIIYETTANGVEDFCKLWRRVKKLAATGQSNWIPVFLSWKDHDEYVRPFTTPEERKRFEESLSKAELDLISLEGLSLEQLNWRRYKIDNEFAGDAEEFAVEYPLNDTECFRSSGKAVFTEAQIKSQETFVEPPKAIGEVEFVDRKGAFMAYKNGDLKVWEGPKANHRYVIGSDSSESAASHDYASAIVIDWTVKRQVAELHGRIGASPFGEKLFALGAWYNWALLVPECNGPGISTVDKLVSLSYPNLYRRKRMKINDYGQMEELEEFGWHTNVQTKPFLVEAGRDALKRILVTFKSADLLDEFRTFVVKSVNEDGYVRYAAEEGFYDDRVMATLITLYAARDVPSHTFMPQRENRPISRTGY